MKKFFVFACLMVSIFVTNVVYAQEIYFENKNNVILTECEYNFISELFYEGFQEIMSIDDYNRIFSNGINCQVDVVNGQETYNINGSTHTTQNKSLNISKACSSSNCVVTVTLTWINMPYVRSYDVIGSYLDGTSLTYNSITSYVNNSVSTETQYQTHGFGTSLKLPVAATSITAVQYYTVSKVGSVYASYQHAISNISLTNSKKYTISRQGYGGVLLFDSSVNSYYDGMSGVNISL